MAQYHALDSPNWKRRAMITFATVVGLAAAVCTTAANVPQLKKAWTTGQTDDISMNMLLVLGSGLAFGSRMVSFKRTS